MKKVLQPLNFAFMVVMYVKNPKVLAITDCAAGVTDGHEREDVGI